METKEILKKALEEIKPTKGEVNETLSKIDVLLKKLNGKLKNSKAILGGSGAKGTWLKGIFDIDIFVLFDYEKFKDKSDKLSDILEKQIKALFPKLKRLHGSRDYFQLKQDKFSFELIPILSIKKAADAINITDVSPLHAKWVNKFPNLKDDIMLTKQFCRGAGVYGAESYIQGFSGYVCEILTIYYKGFVNLVKNAAKWKDKVIIDIENYYKNKNPLLELNKSKTYNPLIIIDPVQADRNAATSLNKENFERFIASCKKFLNKPSINLFRVKKINYDIIKKKAGKNKLIFAEVAALEGKEDVIGSKLLKAFNFIYNNLANYGFKIIEKGWSFDKEEKAMYYFIMDNKALPAAEKRIGPPVKLKNHAESFKKKYKKTFVEKGKICANVKREFLRAEDMIKKLIKSPYVTERVQSIKLE